MAGFGVSMPSNPLRRVAKIEVVSMVHLNVIVLPGVVYVASRCNILSKYDTVLSIVDRQVSSIIVDTSTIASSCSISLYRDPTVVPGTTRTFNQFGQALKTP